MTLPHFTKLNGWTMTSSLGAGSEALDPVRFAFSVSNIDGQDYSLDQCLLENAWRTKLQGRCLCPFQLEPWATPSIGLC